MYSCFSVLEECENLYESYGEICVQCNCCGRFDKSTMYQSQLEMYERQLKETQEFNNSDVQKKNMRRHILYLEDRIVEIKTRMERK